MAKLIHIPEEYMPAIEELPTGLQWIATQIEDYLPGQGVSMALTLAQIFRGVRVYMPTIDALARKIRDDGIRAEYDKGTPVKEIALNTHLVQRQVERILAKPASASQKELEKKQGRLW